LRDDPGGIARGEDAGPAGRSWPCTRRFSPCHKPPALRACPDSRARAADFTSGCRLGRIRALLPLRWARHGPGPRGGHESGKTRSQTVVRSLQPTPEAAPPRAGPKRNDLRKIRRRSPAGSTQLVPAHPCDDIGEATGKSTRGGRCVGGQAWATLILHQPRLRCLWDQHCSVRGQTAAKKRSGKNPRQAPVSLFCPPRAPNLPRPWHERTLGTPAVVGRFRLTHSPALLWARPDSTKSHRSVRQVIRMPFRA